MSSATIDEAAAAAADRPVVARLARWWPTVALALTGIAAGWSRRWFAEDAYINLRVVEQVAAGHGPVVNLGERVEAYTSPLWLAAAVLGRSLLGTHVQWALVTLGLALSVAALVMAVVAAGRAVASDGGGRAPLLLVPVSGWLLLGVSPFRDFMTSGLETGLTFAWLAGVALLLVEVSRAPARTSGAGATDARALSVLFVLGLGPVIRPDLAIVTAVGVGALAVLQRDRLRARPRRNRSAALALAALALLAVPVAYQVFRMGYFGVMVPNTAVAKRGGRPMPGRGLAYLRDLASTDALGFTVPAAVLSAMAVQRSLRTPARRLVALWAVPVGGALHGVYVVLIGGDYMQGRLLLPATFAVLSPAAAFPFPAVPRWTRAFVPSAAIASILVSVVAVGVYAPRPDGTRPDARFWNERERYSQVAGHPHPVTVDDYSRHPFVEMGRRAAAVADRPVVLWALHPELPRVGRGDRAAVVDGSLGLVAYVAGPDVDMVDPLGLGDPVAARLDGPCMYFCVAGHERLMPESWAAVRAGVDPAAPGLPPTQPAEMADVDAALRCGEVADLLGAITEPLTQGRFVRNLLGAPGRGGFLIPVDPAAARDRLCGR